jgi:hypothetical protein
MSGDNPFGKVPGGDEEFEIGGLDEIDSKFRIPEGAYRMRLIELEKGTSKADNPMWIWTFVVVSGDHEGTELKTWTALTPAAMWKLSEVLEALGFEAKDGRAKFKKEEAIGREVMAEVVDSEYQGRTNSSISTLKPLEEGDKKQKKGKKK